MHNINTILDTFLQFNFLKSQIILDYQLNTRFWVLYKINWSAKWIVVSIELGWEWGLEHLR